MNTRELSEVSQALVWLQNLVADAFKDMVGRIYKSCGNSFSLFVRVMEALATQKAWFSRIKR